MDIDSMTKTKATVRMTAQRKLEVYQKTRDANAPIGEILREYGLHLDDLRQIEATVESAALAALKVHGSHHKVPSDVTPERVAQLEQEVHEKTQALAELSVAFITLEKKDRLSSSPLRVGTLLRQKSVNGR
jgi:hypothetical protein